MCLEMPGPKGGKIAGGLLEGDWVTKGSLRAVQMFLEERPLREKQLHQALEHCQGVLQGFLGRGRFGRVYRAKKDLQDCALQICPEYTNEVDLSKEAAQNKCQVVQVKSDLR